MKFWRQPSRAYEFTSPVVDNIKFSPLTIKPISTFIFANPIWRKKFTTRDINERILETPFILGNISTNPTQILDVGACESPISLMLATMGHQVTALDLRAYPFAHPNLTSVVGDVNNFKGQFDTIICLSTLEHIGLEVYGGNAAKLADNTAIKNMYKLLKKNGRLLLTTPINNHPRNFSVWKEYTVADLQLMLKEFKKIEIKLGAKTKNGDWEIVTKLPDNFANTPTGVALIVATK